MIKQIGKALFNNYANGVKYLAYLQPNVQSLKALNNINNIQKQQNSTRRLAELLQDVFENRKPVSLDYIDRMYS